MAPAAAIREPRGLKDMLWLTPANGTLYAIQLPLLDGQPGFVWHQVRVATLSENGSPLVSVTRAGSAVQVPPPRGGNRQCVLTGGPP